MSVATKTDISQSRMDVESHIPKMFEEAKAIIKEHICMRFHDETKPLYIETDASGVGLGAALLQTKENMSFHRDKAQDNSILKPIVFARKSLILAEKRYSNIEGENHWAHCTAILIVLPGR